MWGRKIRPRRLSAIFLPGIFLLPPIFERIPITETGKTNSVISHSRLPKAENLSPASGQGFGKRTVG
jgi:hypothetical protein